MNRNYPEKDGMACVKKHRIENTVSLEQRIGLAKTHFQSLV